MEFLKSWRTCQPHLLRAGRIFTRDSGKLYFLTLQEW